MSGHYSLNGSGPGPGVGVKKKGALATNGSGPPPLIYSTDPPPQDENKNEVFDENVELTVILPDGSQTTKSMESNIPMMDLLVNLAASHKLNPASHSLVVLSDDKWKQVDFKANKTIGLLAGEDRLLSVQIIPRRVEDKVRAKSTVQPFEMTYRFTVNFPHNQKKVLRISPKLSLGEVRLLVSKDKGVDPSAYAFQLPSNPEQQLDESTTIGDLKTSEINFVSVAVLKAAESRSLPELAYAATMAAADIRDAENTRPREGYMPSTGEKKAKRGFLSFLGKKDKKFKVQQDVKIEGGSTAKRKTQSFSDYNNRDDSQERPKSMFVSSGNEVPTDMRRTTGDLHVHINTQNKEYRRSIPVRDNITVSVSQLKEIPENVKNQQAAPKRMGKKKAAPPPPQTQKKDSPKTIQVEIEVRPKMDDRDEVSRIEDLPDVRVPLKKLHSRNSSDSSGYHELTLSGAESPDGVKIDNLQMTLDTTSIDSGEHFNGDSGIRDMSPAGRRRRGEDNIDTGTLEKTPEEAALAAGRKVKKKRAPLPPPTTSACSILVEKRHADPSAPHVQTTSTIQRDEENEALQAMEEVTMKFNIDDDDDDDLQMVENASIHSEDIDIDVDRRQRPPTFVAPPPPCEPPPDDEELVDITDVMNQYDRIDVGVGDDTTCSSPASIDSRPVDSRPDSRASSSSASSTSVNTLEDLSRAFKLTIALGEEALVSDNDSDQEELSAAMPDFREKISKLSDGMEEGSPSARSQHSEQGTDSDASFIIYENESGKLDFDPVQDRESAEITYEFTVDSVPPEFGNENKGDDSEESDEEVENVVEEVSYYPAHPVALDIGTPRKIPDLESPKEHKQFSLPGHGILSDIPIDKSTPKESVQKADEKKKSDKSEEEKEFVISLDELSNMDFSASQPGHKTSDSERERSYSQDRVSYRIQFRKSDEIFPDEVQREEASNVSKEPVFYDDDDDDFYRTDNEVLDGVKTKCSELSFSPDTEGELEHVMEEKSISMIALPAERTPIKHSIEVEDSHKTYASTTKIILSGSSDRNYEQPGVSSAGGMSPRLGEGGISPRSDGSGLSPRSDASGLSPRGDGVGLSPRRDSETQNLMQAQYQQLQQQFGMWQNQLLQNQKQLASSSTNQLAGADDQSNLQLQQLQLQMQMQQQMMLQLQQSMHSLTLQQSIAATQQPFVTPAVAGQPVVPQVAMATQSANIPENIEPVMQSVSHVAVSADPAPQSVLTPPPPPPQIQEPPPPPPAAKPKVVKADAKYTKPKQKRFERQLDPREKLMLDIRSAGRSALKKVPVKATHWHK